MILTEKSYSEWLNYHIQKRKSSRHLPVPDTACYLCRMKKMIMMIAAGIVLTAVPLSAQFNTLMAGTENTDGNTSLETGTGDTEGASGMTADAVWEVWVRRYLSVCYPLRKMKVNSPYGYRTDPFTGKRRFHNGIDLHARGDEALAMMEGTVLKVGQDRTSGKYVVLRHGEFTVSYCHLSRILVSKGASVRPRDAVGITGSTGRSTGEHLHITCRRNGKYVDPTEIFGYIKTMREKCVAALAEMSQDV